MIRVATRLRFAPGAFLLAGLLLAAAPAAPQEPERPPPDSLPPPPDTVVLVDSVPQGPVPPDTVRPLERLPVFPDDPATGFAAGVWEWDIQQLLLLGPISLADLLERIPGVVPVRAGLWIQPEALGSFGNGGGRVEVVLDGFTLDPLSAAAIDFARLELIQLTHVRVERRMDGLRVELQTAAPSDERPYSRIEAATGDFETDVFRGILLAPHFLFGPFAGAVERKDTEGRLQNETANTFSTWAKWGYVRGDHGVQLEIRRAEVERAGASIVVGGGERTDWIARARTKPLSWLTAEAFFGQSETEDQLVDTVDVATRQFGARAAVRAGPLHADGVLRLRTGDWLPEREARLEAGADLAWLHLTGSAEFTDWRRGGDGTAFRGLVRLGPALGATLFGEVGTGTSGVPGIERAARAPVFTQVRYARAGAQLEIGGFRVGAAALALEADSVATFGLAFDAPIRLLAAGSAEGVEAFARLPLFWSPLALEAQGIAWRGDEWQYRPDYSGRVGLTYHHLPLPSGLLEILARAEVVVRGPMLIPGSTGLVDVPGFTRLDGYLQIRVWDVRAFIRWENLLRQEDIADLPGRDFPPQRVLYGVKWNFWN